MSTRTFSMVTTVENRIGLAIVDNDQVSGLLLIALLANREAVVYIVNNHVYVYSADVGSTYLSETEQLDSFLTYARQFADIEIIARGKVRLDSTITTTHISVGDTLVASAFEDNTASLLIVDRLKDGRADAFGIDIYDPSILVLVNRDGKSAIKTLVLAINETLLAKDPYRHLPKHLH